MPKRFPLYRPHGRRAAPVATTSAQRWQTLAVLLHCSSIILLPALFFLLVSLGPLWWPPLAAYLVYYLVLRPSVTRQSSWLKSQWIYAGFMDYFPIKLHKTVKLPPSLEDAADSQQLCYPAWTSGLPHSLVHFMSVCGLISRRLRHVTVENQIGPRYLFAYHPHGVIAFGITGAMCYENPADTSRTQFGSLFPGVKAHLLTLTSQFLVPFYRDYIMALGVGLVTKSSIRSILNLGHSVVIVVGGAHESLLAKPGKNSIVLNRRKGFIKMALQATTVSEDDFNLTSDQFQTHIANGTWEKSMGDMAVVPVYGFGENNIYDVYRTTNKQQDVSSREGEGKILHGLLKLQLLLKKHFGFTLPLVNARGIYNYDFGLLPYRRKVDVVFGKPIYIIRKFGKKPGEPVDQNEIDYYHDIYKKSLIKLWNDNKHFKTEWDDDLEFVE